MEAEDDESQSSLWSCVILKGNCNLFNAEDSRVFYFVVTAFVFYAIFLFLILADLKYWWSLDKAQQQMFYYVDSIKCKLRNVQTQQRHMKECHGLSEEYVDRSNSLSRMLRAAAGGCDNGCYSAETVTECVRNRHQWTSSPALHHQSGNWEGDCMKKDNEFCVI